MTKNSTTHVFRVVYLQILHQLTGKAESRFKSARPYFYHQNKNINFKKAKEIYEEMETCVPGASFGWLDSADSIYESRRFETKMCQKCVLTNSG